MSAAMLLIAPSAGMADKLLEITSVTMLEDKSLEITSVTMLEDGYLSVEWTDTGADEYDVYWLQSSGEENPQHMGTFSAACAEISYVPGVNCEIVVTDSKDNSAREELRPGKAPDFQDGNWTSGIKKVTLKARRALGAGKYKDYAAFPLDEMEDSTDEWGLYISYQYPSLAATRCFHEMMTVTDPYGNITILHDGTEEYENHSRGEYYNYYDHLYSLSWYFDLLSRTHDGIIPRGNYTWSLYWDGMYVNSSTFAVK